MKNNILKSMKSNKIIHTKAFKIGLCVFLLLILPITVFYTYTYKKYDVDKMKATIEKSYSTVLLDTNDDILTVFITDDGQWHLKSDYKIPDNLKKAVLLFEDKNFYRHRGIDFRSLGRAFINNMKGMKKSGASTITMQVAKILSPKKRSYYNKIKEIVVSKKIENNFTKDEILAIYLNNAPYGGNVIGYGTASELYFKKKPWELTWAECALLAVLPNSPGLINVEKNRDKLLVKRNRLLKRCYEKGYMESIQYDLAVKEPLPVRKFQFEKIAPHLCRRLSDETSMKIIRSTIDGRLQRAIEDTVTNYSEYTKSEGISNISVLVIENKTSDVKCYVGSQDFLDFENNGQVDGVTAKRSPGSILKPFLYALSIDDGLIAPQSKVPDVPLFFSNFRPQNANKMYNGMIEIRSALIKSLNIPFVHLLQEYGEERFFYFLKDVLGFEDSDPTRYGLSIILGTKEFSVEDMGILYSGLANYGRFKKLNYLKRSEKNEKDQEYGSEDPGKKLISSGASYLTLNTIKELERPGMQNHFKWKDPISWKTGTSYGRRDAWACGVTPDYTVIVWVGNFSGKGNSNLSGVISGGRLLFNIFNNLSGRGKKFPIPNDLEEIAVDKLTGYSIEYPELESRKILFPISGKSLRKSPFYKKIFVNSKGEEIDSRSKEFIDRKEKVILNYPLEVVNYFIRENMDVSQIYDKKTTGQSIKIIYPTNGLKILLPKDFDGDKNIIVKVANLKKQELYWYLDKEYIGKDSDFKKEMKIPNGKHSITIMSEDGELSKVNVEIMRTGR